MGGGEDWPLKNEAEVSTRRNCSREVRAELRHSEVRAWTRRSLGRAGAGALSDGAAPARTAVKLAAVELCEPKPELDGFLTRAAPKLAEEAVVASQIFLSIVPGVGRKSADA